MSSVLLSVDVFKGDSRIFRMPGAGDPRLWASTEWVTLSRIVFGQDDMVCTIERRDRITTPTGKQSYQAKHESQTLLSFEDSSFAPKQLEWQDSKDSEVDSYQLEKIEVNQYLVLGVWSSLTSVRIKRYLSENVPLPFVVL